MEALKLLSQAQEATDDKSALQCYKKAQAALQTAKKKTKSDNERALVEAAIATCNDRIEHYEKASPSTRSSALGAMQFAVEHQSEIENAAAMQQNMCDKVSTAGGISGIKNAAAVGAVVGLAFVGPVGALAGGIGAAYVATKNTTEGDVARKAGAAAATAFKSAKSFNEEHQVVAKVSAAAKNMDQKYHIRQNAAVALSNGIRTAKAIDQEYHLKDRATKSLVSALDSAAASSSK